MGTKRPRTTSGGEETKDTNKTSEAKVTATNTTINEGRAKKTKKKSKKSKKSKKKKKKINHENDEAEDDEAADDAAAFTINDKKNDIDLIKDKLTQKAKIQENNIKTYVRERVQNMTSEERDAKVIPFERLRKEVMVKYFNLDPTHPLNEHRRNTKEKHNGACSSKNN